MSDHCHRNQALYLQRGFGALLGAPSEGNMAFCRCLPREVLFEVCKEEQLQVAGWRVLGVSSLEPRPENFIGPDQAVDLRERKEDSVLLLMDPSNASIGMDGIYSAVREIDESTLLGKATREACGDLEPRLRSFVDAAVKKVKRSGTFGRLNNVSPWREFKFCSDCACEPDNAGQLVSELGLWPIEISNGPDIRLLENSVLMVNRLLIREDANLTIEERVDSLLLSDPNIAAKLIGFLRRNEGRRWTEISKLAAIDSADIWVNSFESGLDQQCLQTIKLHSWRKDPKGPPYKWSGLDAAEDEEVLEYRIDREGSGRPLEVRWDALPEGLPSGAFDYIVSIETGASESLVSARIGHKNKKTQFARFRTEDFSELDDGKWEARVVVEPADQSDTSRPLRRESEEFILTFGAREESVRSGAGVKTRALIDEAIRLDSLDQVREAAKTPPSEDAAGYISVRMAGKSGRVFRPRLLRMIEEEWLGKDCLVGRWVVQTRPDGSFVSPPQFLSCDPAPSADLLERLNSVSRAFGKKLSERRSTVGLIHLDSDITVNYVNAWANVLEASSTPQIALAHTLEVQSLSGNTVGLIVLPFHPIRVAWHQAYDNLATHMRYVEKLSAARTQKALETLDGAEFPGFLPPLNGKEDPFVFGDTLGFYHVAMIPAGTAEPQAAIAHLARCLSSDEAGAVPSSSTVKAKAIAKEIDRYLDLHGAYTNIDINAIRAGDGLAIAMALKGVIESDPPPEASFRLSLFGGENGEPINVTGRYLSERSERRRSGVKGTAGTEWIRRTMELEGLRIAQFQWSKRNNGHPEEAAHVSVGFDLFESEVQSMPPTPKVESACLEAYGLAASIVREYTHEPTPVWGVSVSASSEGDPHPAGRSFTQRLTKTHHSILRLVAEDPACWPTLVSSLQAENRASLKQLHHLSDWVITLDKSAGLEYFDSPVGSDPFQAYIIDCVPERHDHNNVRLVTSTSKVDEVLELLNDTLEEMALSRSQRNSEHLLGLLKAVSGRIAMRIAGNSKARSEMVALAMLYQNCLGKSDPIWMDLRKGFMVPLDDVADLLRPLFDHHEDDPSADDFGDRRADLMHVCLSARGALEFTFVEVKFRRLLTTARSLPLVEEIRAQVAATRGRWNSRYFSGDLSDSERVLHRRGLAKALTFYLEKAKRHALEPECYEQLSSSIARLYRADYRLGRRTSNDRGFVFCPEYFGPPEKLTDDSGSELNVILFGPEGLPDLNISAAATSHASASDSEEWEDTADELPDSHGEPKTVTSDSIQGSRESLPEVPAPAEEPPVTSDQIPPQQASSAYLGNATRNATPISWSFGIDRNPHLMIIGLPGMGKTTCLIRLCCQLQAAGVSPIVFAYHEDIEQRLAQELGDLNVCSIGSGLGFNPLKISNSERWLDRVGMLRDIFSAVFPDFGDIQTNEIRRAIRESFTELGYNKSEQGELKPPVFRRFFDILKAAAKPNQGIILRLEELDDYSFFDESSGNASLLVEGRPTVVRLHDTQNEALQRAFSAFALFNIYQAMFLRGLQKRLTHAVIFDEAHRASRLTLIPTMAKECRKYGISMVVASQESKDFPESLYAAIANYLILKVGEADSRGLGKLLAKSRDQKNMAGKLMEVPRYHGWFSQEGDRPVLIKLA